MQAASLDSGTDSRLIYGTLGVCLVGLVIIQIAIRGGGAGIFSLGIPLAGGAILIGAWRRWEFGIQALMVVVIVEGAVRKWLLPSASEMVYFYKDVLMVVILITYLLRAKKKPLAIKAELRILVAALGGFAAYGVATLATIVAASGTSLRIPHPVLGLLGFKAYFLYIPLAFLVPRMFCTRERVIKFLKWYSLIVLPVAMLCATQFADQNQSATVNKYANEVQGQISDIAVFSDSLGNSYVRVTGPFSYISGLTTYLPTMFALLLSLISLGRSELSALTKWLFYAAVGAVVVVTFMTGSRAPVVVLMVTALIYYGLTSLKDLFRRLIQVSALGLIVFAGLFFLYPQAISALYERALGDETRTSESLERISEPLAFPIDEAYHAGATGFGIGTTQNAAPALMRILDSKSSEELVPIASEGEPGRVMLELGVIGFLLYLLLRLALIITVCRTCLSVRDPRSRVIAIGILCSLAAPLLLGGAVVSHTQNVYQWFLVGASIALLNAESGAARVPTRLSDPVGGPALRVANA